VVFRNGTPAGGERNREFPDDFDIAPAIPCAVSEHFASATLESTGLAEARCVEITRLNLGGSEKAMRDLFRSAAILRTLRRLTMPSFGTTCLVLRSSLVALATVVTCVVPAAADTRADAPVAKLDAVLRARA